MDDQTRRPLKARTWACQALGAGDPSTHALVPPIHMSATYLRDADNGYSGGYVYGRADNATVQQAEALLAALEGADEAMTFCSGMAAATTLFLALDRPTHIVASEIMYWGFRAWLREINRYGHSVTFVDTSDLQAVTRAIRPGETGLFFIETPSNPLWTVTDIAALSEIAHSAGALLCVDSTVSTPVFTQPIALGADIVVHSATKYLNGHSDIVAGALAAAGPSSLWTNIQRLRTQLGNTLGPFEAWLLMRGIRTLDLRVREQAKTAAMLARCIDSHPALSSVLYPGLKSHPGHEVALRQMNGGFGGMLSIRMKGGSGAAVRVAAGVKVWKRATSLGGVESLIEHRASIEGPGTPCPGDLLRLSAGLEDPDDLLFDLIRALEAAC
ncbi:trans-sulfuration enzyme family protein [Rhodoplanes sp. Z2-YC6860]|uniref:trans-sulfuration enzyme family protein n=1 Tax=Rhodoplanes sp. Z2-YC6860 TaxID=674703 RepID=UPI00078CB3E0|nr:aminotransferase class I/II-fold pyridoxal phosphate-dependent enzyme [Rhodoplanes sp. Z2-YC6860]AMN45024.1 cystathionine gamma-synthase [Rhodoplanes sp. Z2-YC6860]